MTDEYVEVRGIRVAYSEAGEGPVVLQAHGLTSSRASDAPFGLFDMAPVAAAGFRVVAYDARGHGRTEGSADSADYTWAALADDLLALADHFSPDAPVSAIGSSMGTGTILHAVAKRPDRFRKLVLTAPPTAWETRAAQAAVYAAMADVVEASSPEALATLLDGAPLAPIFRDVPGFPPPPAIRFELLPTVFRGAGLADLPDRQAIRAIRQPTLLLPWATDPGHPLSTAEALAALLPDSTLSVAETSADIRTWGAQAAAFLSRCEA
jgi:3-oxoadipate enol-lactonase